MSSQKTCYCISLEVQVKFGPGNTCFTSFLERHLLTNVKPAKIQHPDVFPFFRHPHINLCLFHWKTQPAPYLNGEWMNYGWLLSSPMFVFFFLVALGGRYRQRDFLLFLFPPSVTGHEAQLSVHRPINIIWPVWRWELVRPFTLRANFVSSIASLWYFSSSRPLKVYDQLDQKGAIGQRIARHFFNGKFPIWRRICPRRPSPRRVEWVNLVK